MSASFPPAWKGTLDRAGAEAAANLRAELERQRTLIGPYDPLIAFVTRSACEELELRAGASVTALIKVLAVHVIARGG